MRRPTNMMCRAAALGACAALALAGCSTDQSGNDAPIDAGASDAGPRPPVFLRLNVGGPSYVGSETWDADGASLVEFSTANWAAPGGPFSNNAADDQVLLGSARWWDIGAGQAATATVRGLRDGSYTVRFLVAEGVWTSPGQRIFGFVAEGLALDDNIDPLVLAGGRSDTGVWVEYDDIAVSDGELDLQWTARVDNPEVRALELAGPGFAITPFQEPHFPRLGGYPLGAPQNYDAATFRDIAIKYHVLVLTQWPGWQAGRTMTMAAVMQDIKTRSRAGTRLFIYVNNNEMRCSMSSGSYLPAWQKIEAERWWLYPSGVTGSPVVSTFGGGAFCVVNNTTFGTIDGAGKNWMRWKADFDYQFDVAGDVANDPNPYVDGFFLDNVFWKPRVDGDWDHDGATDSQATPAVQGWLRDGSKSYFDYLRLRWPTGVQLGNPDWGDASATIGVMDQVLAGGAMEGMIGYSWSVETWGGFDLMMSWYRKWMDAYGAPKLAIFGQDNWVTGDYRTMRYGLASTLMDDAYFYITDGDGSYSPLGCCGSTSSTSTSATRYSPGKRQPGRKAYGDVISTTVSRWSIPRATERRPSAWGASFTSFPAPKIQSRTMALASPA